MKKASRWLLLALTFCVAVAGFLIRRRQLATELLPKDGSLVEGSTLHIFLAVLSGILFVGLIAFLIPLRKKESWRQVFPTAMLPNLLLILSAVLLIVGNILLWAANSDPVEKSSEHAAYASRSPAISGALATLLPPLGIVCAICFIAFAVLRIRERKPTPLLFMIASVYLIIRLIVCFQVWNTDPSIHDYAFQLLAAICCMLGCFQLAGFSFDRGHLRMCLFWTLGATAFCSFTVADTLRAYALHADTLRKYVLSDIIVNASLLLAMATCSVCLLLTDGPLPDPEPAEAETLPADAPTEEAPEEPASEIVNESPEIGVN